MGETREIVDADAVGRLFALLAVVGPVAGLVIGAACGMRTHRVRQSSLAGLLWGLLGVLNWLVWRAYNAITDRNGLDTVKNLFINLALFTTVGIVIGAGAAFIRRGANSPDAQEQESKDSDNPVSQ